LVVRVQVVHQAVMAVMVAKRNSFQQRELLQQQVGVEVLVLQQQVGELRV
jgi:hypothetical protein